MGWDEKGEDADMIPGKDEASLSPLPPGPVFVPPFKIRLSRDDQFTKEMREGFLATLSAAPNTLAACRKLGIPWSLFFHHYHPTGKYYDPEFAQNVDNARKKFGYKLMEEVLFPMAQVKKTSHFNYTAMALRGTLPEHFDRNRAQIGIQLGDHVKVTWNGENLFQEFGTIPAEEQTAPAAGTGNTPELPPPEPGLSPTRKKHGDPKVDHRTKEFMTDERKQALALYLAKAREVCRKNREERRKVETAIASH